MFNKIKDEIELFYLEKDLYFREKLFSFFKNAEELMKKMKEKVYYNILEREQPLFIPFSRIMDVYDHTNKDLYDLKRDNYRYVSMKDYPDCLEEEALFPPYITKTVEKAFDEEVSIFKHYTKDYSDE